MAEIVVNHQPREVGPEATGSLLAFLREDLDLCGAKRGCEGGACGACTVLLDGRAVRSCGVPVAEAAGRAVTTVEGLADAGRLHPVARAFAEIGAMQCGYCTPGMVMAATALLAGNASPGGAQVGEALQGNICRCGGHLRIVQAVLRAAELMRTGDGDALPVAGGSGGDAEAQPVARGVP